MDCITRATLLGAMRTAIIGMLAGQMMLIKSSGYRIGPFEIESVIMELPYVLECAVVPAPDPVRGQVVKAVVVLTRGTEKTRRPEKRTADVCEKTYCAV